jgi:hypothetical protein
MHKIYIVLTSFVLLILGLPVSTNLVLAANVPSADPSCSLYYFHDNSFLETKSLAELSIVKNNFVGLLWNGTNIIDASDIQGKKISALGFEIIKPTKDVTYSYTFYRGSQKVTCSLSITVLSGDFSVKDTYKSGEKITVAGNVIGTNKVIVDFNSTSKNSPVYTTKTIIAKNEKFKLKMPKVLPDGKYMMVLKTADTAATVIATSSVTVGKVKVAPASSLVVQNVPLLSGGTVKAGNELPIAYLQIINIGENPATINGLSFRQVGNASVSTIAKLSITDQYDTLNGFVGSGTSVSPFLGDTAKVPTQITLASKESRLFTVRAVVSANAATNMGRSISLALLSLESNSTITSALPIYNPLWTIIQ